MNADVLQLRQKLLAQELVLLVLISTHPNPGQLLERLRTYALSMEANFLASPNSQDSDRESAMQEVVRWIEALEKRMEGEILPNK